MEERHVVHAAGEVRQQVADPQAALAPPTERVQALQQVARLAEERVECALAGEWRAVVLVKFRLVVESIDVTDAAGGEDVDGALRFGGNVGSPLAGRWLGAVAVGVEQ